MFNLRATLEGLSIVDDDGRHHTARPQVVDVAVQIADLYVRECSRMAGRYERISEKSAPFLYKAAQLCLDLGKTPSEFVAVQLRGMLSSGQLWIRALASPHLHQEGASNGDVTLDAVAYYKAQLALFNDRSRLYGPTFALEDTANEFSPLFRWVLARDLGLTELAKAYAEAAHSELLTNPVARDVFGTRIAGLGTDDNGPAHPPAHGAGDEVKGAG